MGCITGSIDGIGFCAIATIDGIPSAAPGGSPSVGALGEVQLSDGAGDLTSDSEFIFNVITRRLGILEPTPLSTLHVDGNTVVSGGTAASSANGIHSFFTSNIGTITSSQSGVGNRDLVLQGLTMLLQANGGNRLRISGPGVLIGPGTVDADGTCHVQTASAGTVTPDAGSDNLTVENSVSCGISILNPANMPGTLAFGSPNNNNEGRIIYTHGGSSNTGSMAFIVSSALALNINSDRDLIVTFGLNPSRAGFAVSSATVNIGHRGIYACTDTTAARTLTISTANIARGSTANPWVFSVKDESGGAGTNNITINTQAGQLIDGEATLVIEVDHGAVTLYSDGSNLFVKGAT